MVLEGFDSRGAKNDGHIMESRPCLAHVGSPLAHVHGQW